MTGLAPVDGAALLAVVVKAMGYGAALLAMGGVLFVFVFARRAAPDVVRVAQRLAVAAALIGLVILAARFGIRAARISGMGVDGALDPVMLGFVWDSPLGTAAVWRGTGELAILALLVPRWGRWIALAGCCAVAVSYTQVGHSLGAPRGALAGLVGVHLLAAALWVGALMPLRRAASTPHGADLLHNFGTVAAYGVAVLVVAGVALAWLLSGSLSALFGTAYGAGLLLKVAGVSVLLGFAALNKLRLVPALRAGTAGAGPALKRSILAEAVAVAVILLATAALTVLTTPPVNL